MFDDGIFVGIVTEIGESTAPDETDAIASVEISNEAEKGYAIGTVKSDGTASLELYHNDDTKLTSSAAANATFGVVFSKLLANGSYQDDANSLKVKATATFKTGDLEITGFNYTEGNFPVEIEAGNYRVEVTFKNTYNTDIVVTYYATID